MKFICLDIETTGFDPQENSVLEIAAIKYDLNQNYETFHHFVEYKGTIPALIQKLTSITSDDVFNAPALDSLKQDLINFCGDLPIMGHNISFDTNFLSAKGIQIPGPLLDTMPLSHMAFDNLESFSLEILCKKHNKDNLPSHRAIDDVKANIELFRTICQRLDQIPQANKDLLIQALENSQNQSAKIYLDLFKEIFTQNHTPQTQSDQTPEHSHTLITAIDFNLIHKNKLESQLLLKNPNNFINKDLVIQNTQNPHSDIFSLMRIIPKLGAQTHIDDVNFRSDQFNQIHKFCHTEFQEIGKKHYICSIETLLEYHNSKQIPNQTKVEIIDGPYLEESFLHFYETTIRSSDFETPENSEEITFIYMHLIKFLREELKLYPDQNFFGIIDKFILTQAGFSDFIFKLKQQTLNPKALKKLEQFEKDIKNGHVFCMLVSDNMPTFKSIPANLHVDKRSLLEFLTGLHAEIKTGHKTNKFLIDTQDLGISQKDPMYIETLTEQIFQSLKDTSQKALVICPSADNIKYIYEKLCLKFQELGIELLAQNQSGSKGKILANLADDQSTPQILLCTHHFLLKFNPDLHGCKKAILTKLPIGSPSHFYYKIKEKQAENSFIEIAIPNTANNLNHICGMLANQQIDHLFLLDDRMDSTGWGKNIKRKLDQFIEFI